MSKTHYTVSDLLYVMSRLREPEYGCPWDIEQTVETIIPHTIEEVHELVEALLHESPYEQKDEMADVLFQVVFYAQIKQEEGDFEFNDVVNHLVEKLIRRHPHVFDKDDLHKRIPLSEKPSLEGIAQSWQEIKATEKALKQQAVNGNLQEVEGEKHILDNIASSLPGLKKAYNIQKTVAKVGFDWDNYRDVVAKIEEETAEIIEAKTQHFSQQAIEEEVGDLLFACVNLARHLKVDPEVALSKCNAKFVNRFKNMETVLSEGGLATQTASLDQMEAAWQTAKKEEK